MLSRTLPTNSRHSWLTSAICKGEEGGGGARNRERWKQLHRGKEQALLANQRHLQRGAQERG
jgi:hypothetical protein